MILHALAFLLCRCCCPRRPQFLRAKQGPAPLLPGIDARHSEGGEATLVASVPQSISQLPGLSFAWQVEDTQLPDATGPTIKLTYDDLTEKYQQQPANDVSIKVTLSEQSGSLLPATATTEVHLNCPEGQEEQEGTCLNPDEVQPDSASQDGDSPPEESPPEETQSANIEAPTEPEETAPVEGG